MLIAQPNFQAVFQLQTKSAALGPFVVRTLPPPPIKPSKSEYDWAFLVPGKRA